VLQTANEGKMVKDTKYERYTRKFKRRLAELPYREVRRKNLDRIGEMVLQSMMVAGDTPFPEKWQPMLEQIDRAYAENPEHLVVVLWRILCNFSLKK
jgi:membrane-bound lytic murein transglycosylase B